MKPAPEKGKPDKAQAWVDSTYEKVLPRLCDPRSPQNWAAWESTLRQWQRVDPAVSYTSYGTVELEMYAMFLAVTYIRGDLMRDDVSICVICHTTMAQ